MKNNLLKSLRSLVAVFALVLGLAVFATVPSVDAGKPYNLKGYETTTRANEQPQDLNEVFKTIVNILLFIIGAISVIMLVIGGIRYTVSGGSSEQVTAAKNTILYAVIGLIVAILAYAIVNFVVEGLTG